MLKIPRLSTTFHLISFILYILGIIRRLNLNGTLDKEVDVQNIRCNFVEVCFVEVYPFNRF